MDLKLTLDGIVVVHHDQTLDRTTDGTGFISDHTWVQLQALDAGSKHHPRYRGTRVPRLSDVFTSIGERMLYDLELTEYTRPFTALTRKAIQLVSEFDLRSRVLYSSFNPLDLLRASQAIGADQLALL